MVFCKMKLQRRDEALINRIVEELVKIRKERRLTQETVTYDTDIHISRIETGKHSITITTLSDLCKYYKITLEEFFRRVEAK